MPLPEKETKKKENTNSLHGSLICPLQRPLMRGTRPQTAAKKEIILDSKI